MTRLKEQASKFESASCAAGAPRLLTRYQAGVRNARLNQNQREESPCLEESWRRSEMRRGAMAAAIPARACRQSAYLASISEGRNSVKRCINRSVVCIVIGGDVECYMRRSINVLKSRHGVPRQNRRAITTARKRSLSRSGGNASVSAASAGAIN